MGSFTVIILISLIAMKTISTEEYYTNEEDYRTEEDYRKQCDEELGVDCNSDESCTTYEPCNHVCCASRDQGEESKKGVCSKNCASGYIIEYTGNPELDRQDVVEGESSSK